MKNILVIQGGGRAKGNTAQTALNLPICRSRNQSASVRICRDGSGKTETILKSLQIKSQAEICEL